MPELPEDTIRAPKIEDLRAFLVRDGRTAFRAALDVLLAERQHLREALEQIALEDAAALWPDGTKVGAIARAALVGRGPSQDRETAGPGDLVIVGVPDDEHPHSAAVCDPAPPPASDALFEAYAAGWNRSGEGWNAEYPGTTDAEIREMFAEDFPAPARVLVDPAATPMRVVVKYDSSNSTHYFSEGEWKGQRVLVEELLYDEQGPCSGHELQQMTHYDLVVPGEFWCPHCCGVGRLPAASQEDKP